MMHEVIGNVKISRGHAQDVGAFSAGDRRAPGERRAFAKGEELFSDGDSADYFYKIVSGTVQTSKLLVDARRHVDSFHLEGDIFGLESTCVHSLTAEAVEDAVVLAYRRFPSHSVLNAYPALADQLMSAMVDSLKQARNHMLLLARKTPQEKIAMFLLDMATRLKKDDRFDLPMQRTDIADHLGLTKETVSRTLTQMAREGLIKLEAVGRTILLNDRESLSQLTT